MQPWLIVLIVKASQLIIPVNIALFIPLPAPLLWIDKSHIVSHVFAVAVNARRNSIVKRSGATLRKQSQSFMQIFWQLIRSYLVFMQNVHVC